MSNSLIEDLLRQKNEALKRVSDIDIALNALGYKEGTIENTKTINSINASMVVQKIKRKATWDTKIQEVFKHYNRFLHKREIVSYIIENFDNEGKELKFIENNVSGALLRLKEEDKIYKFEYNSHNRNVFWGSKKWVDEEGKIMPNHKYNDSEIYNGGSNFDL